MKKSQIIEKLALLQDQYDALAIVNRRLIAERDAMAKRLCDESLLRQRIKELENAQSVHVR